MEVFKLRFFFDAGSGICMWSANDNSKEKFGDYPIECNQLPISENLWRKLSYLTAWYDTCIDWSYPPNPTPWSTSECHRFNKEVLSVLNDVTRELGKEYIIQNEFKSVIVNS
ncbi:MAG: Unknown protein [uncultured Sulfurovum sp.]|uniref:Uncharacterized protein n=1 Tax=uncultured Sulfurovum sp. TaxID=269237 RepID=A0A6S6TM97_9BACT|nr:MAG: Unknown protein [uncultured Sulfurovum sp.]